MKKILIATLILFFAVSSIFSAPKLKPFEEWSNSEKERIVYNNELRKFGLRDVDGIDYDVKVELVKRLYKRHKEELEHYKELMENPPENYEFTEYDMKMIESIKIELLQLKALKEFKAIMEVEKEKYKHK